jgi:hypothetical protein
LFDLVCCQGKHGKHFHHDVDDDIGHRRGERDLSINPKAIEEVPNTFEQVEESVITCADSDSRLKYRDATRA